MREKQKPRSVTSVRRFLMGTTMMVSLVSATTPVVANPTGGRVVGGSAVIQGQGTSNVTIRQQSNRAAIDWDTFSLSKTDTVTYQQPHASSVALNRVVGGDASVIAGTIQSNGHVFLINPNGILFTQDARLDVGGLVASTLDLSTQDFMAGNYTFSADNTVEGAAVINEGQITVAEAGLAALVAPSVRNSGVINARLGTVVLGASNAFTVDFYGDNLVSFALPNSGVDPVDEDGPLVSMDGAIFAQGGVVQISARAARNIVNDALSIDGTVVATSVGEHRGRIIIDGGDFGITRVTGDLFANGVDGGSVDIQGDTVYVDGAVTVRGDGGEGGSVKIKANHTSIGGQIDALGASRGGRVNVETGSLSFAGQIFAQGVYGQGGDVEGSAEVGNGGRLMGFGVRPESNAGLLGFVGHYFEVGEGLLAVKDEGGTVNVEGF